MRAEIILWVLQMRKFGIREVKTFSQGHTGLNCGLMGSCPQVSVTVAPGICLHIREKPSLPVEFSEVTPIWMHLFCFF